MELIEELGNGRNLKISVICLQLYILHVNTYEDRGYNGSQQ